ncbi:facilitated trehalose transporter Tret1-like isoform X1 [Rhynchophorus ferrugineus]|uniref:facilitated trehalose transporter Tret1-like isoform X1 n=1 Tax=Rhynchophorus ferrugineus TaxID=354439 RepID=UPI003FCD30D5
MFPPGAGGDGEEHPDDGVRDESGNAHHPDSASVGPKRRVGNDLGRGRRNIMAGVSEFFECACWLSLIWITDPAHRQETFDAVDKYAILRRFLPFLYGVGSLACIPGLGDVWNHWRTIGGTCKWNNTWYLVQSPILIFPTLIYVVEITCASLRGSLVSTSTLAILVGVITSFTLGALLLWRSMALVNGCVSLFGLITLTFIPESPYWLTEMGRTEDARRSLAWLRGWVDLEDVDEEYQQICDDLNKKVRRSCEVESYRKGSFIKPFLLVSFAFFLAHFGITPINIYAVKIFQQLRVPVDSFLATILIGCVELTASVLLSLVVPRFGKRKLTFLSLAGVCINHILTAITAYVLGSNADDAARYLKWVPLFTILSATFFGYLMVYTLPWIIMGEIFPNQIRDSAAGFSAGTGYVIGFLANKIFLGLVDMATLSGVLLMYSAIELVGIAVMYVWLPETEGKSLDDIMMYFVSRKKREGRVSPGKTDGIENKSYETEENSNTNV